jgi:hypothetical protein
VRRVELDDLLAERDKINTRSRRSSTSTPSRGASRSCRSRSSTSTCRRDAARDGQQAEAERERRAKVIAAEGEFQAAQRLSEAAAIMAKEPMTLAAPLPADARRDRTENNSTTIFPSRSTCCGRCSSGEARRDVRECASAISSTIYLPT